MDGSSLGVKQDVTVRSFRHPQASPTHNQPGYLVVLDNPTSRHGYPPSRIPGLKRIRHDNLLPAQQPSECSHRSYPHATAPSPSSSPSSPSSASSHTSTQRTNPFVDTYIPSLRSGYQKAGRHGIIMGNGPARRRALIWCMEWKRSREVHERRWTSSMPLGSGLLDCRTYARARGTGGSGNMGASGPGGSGTGTCAGLISRA